MGFYSDIILPRLCNLAMRNKQLVSFRECVMVRQRAGYSRLESAMD
jgi:hypothetical protein